MSNPLIGHGLKFEVESATPGTFTEIKGVLSVEFGSSKVDVVDTTDMGTTGNTRVYSGGLEDPGDVTVKGNFIPADTTQTYLVSCKDGAQHNFKVIYPGAVATETFAGIIQSFDKSSTNDKLIEFTLKVKISGPKTIA